MQAILDACEHLRDRFLFAVLYDSGIRIGEALGLRHEDIAAAEPELVVCPRINDNGARSKSATKRRAHGRPFSYPAVHDLVRRPRRRTGIDFDPHWWRHTAATRLLRNGVPIEVVSKVLGHADITTTLAVYGHLTAEDARRVLEQAGWFTGREIAVVTTPVVSPASDRTSVLGRLMATVRPEFRGDELLFDAGDPVFGGGACRVQHCARSARGRGLCPGHLQRPQPAERQLICDQLLVGL